MIWRFCHFLFLMSPPLFCFVLGDTPFVLSVNAINFHFWWSYSMFPLCIYFYYVFVSYFLWIFLIFDSRQYFFTFSGRWFYLLTTRYFGTREFFSIFYYFVSRPFHEWILLAAAKKLYWNYIYVSQICHGRIPLIRIPRLKMVQN